jgi:hypothetical protein
MTGATREVGGDQVKSNMFGKRGGRLLGGGGGGGGKKEFCLEVDADGHLAESVAREEEKEVRLELYRRDFGHPRGELSGQPHHTVLVITLT